jgi:translation initiation factor 3 subunit L
MKKSEQMYALLAILISFCSQRVDEHVNNVMREKYGDKMLHIQRGYVGFIVLRLVRLATDIARGAQRDQCCGRVVHLWMSQVH